MLEHERKQLSEMKAKYEEAKVDATQNLPHKFVVTSAFVAERKSYPVRWIIVLISLISTFFLMVVVLIILERTNLSSKIVPVEQPKKKSLDPKFSRKISG
jgi:uncharacterized protein involved in exopolysaccharide biosynthesis